MNDNSEEILSLLELQGFNLVTLKSYPTGMQWKPDLIVSRKAMKYYVLVRRNNTIPPIFLSRISNSNTKFQSLIIFQKKCSRPDEKEILSRGISIGYLINGKLYLKIKASKKIISKEVKKKLSVIDIFVSSKQDILEREFIAERIEMLRKTRSYPFSPPHLIEHDKFKLGDLYNYIDYTMDECEWVVIVLEDKHSEVVSYEINRSIETIEHENIFIFVKSTKECGDKWKKELDLIKSLVPPTIKYLPYSNNATLEVNMTKAINLRMDEIYNNHKIKTTN
jgi:hypothetical protein